MKEFLQTIFRVRSIKPHEDEIKQPAKITHAASTNELIVNSYIMVGDVL